MSTRSKVSRPGDISSTCLSSMCSPRATRCFSGLSGNTMANDACDTLMSSLDPPLIVDTAAVGEERAGCLAGFHAQSNIDPGRYCVWLSRANPTNRVALRSTHLGIHLLTSGDLAECRGLRHPHR